MRAVVALVAVALLLPGGAAEPASSSATFQLGPTQDQSFRLDLAKATDVRVTVKFNAGYVEELTLDGPGKCDLTLGASGGGPDATMGSVKCKGLKAGSHSFVLRMGVGYAKGSVVASSGAWAWGVRAPRSRVPPVIPPSP